MKFAVLHWIYGGDQTNLKSIEESMDRLARYGYDGINVVGLPDKVNANVVRELLKSYDLEPAGVSPLYPLEKDLISSDEKVRRNTVQYLKACSKMIAELGGTTVSAVVPSAVGKLSPMASPKEEWKWAIEGLRDVSAYADDLGVNLGVEPLNRLETYFLNRAEQALRLVRTINRDNVTVILDAFHLNIEEISPPDAIREVGDLLIDFHVADSNRLPPGKGHTDWKAIIQALKDIGYDKYLSLEYLTPIDRTLITEEMEARPEVGEKVLSDYIVAHGSGALSKRYHDESTKWAIEYLKKLI